VRYGAEIAAAEDINQPCLCRVLRESLNDLAMSACHSLLPMLPPNYVILGLRA
jgi:hypothetical protein